MLQSKISYKESIVTAGIESNEIDEREYQKYEDHWEKLPDYLQTFIVNPDKSVRWNLTYFREMKRRNNAKQVENQL